MKKVLHYVGTMSRGGIEAFLMNLYRNIDREQIQFDFAVHVQKKGDFDDEIFDHRRIVFVFRSDGSEKSDMSSF